MDLKPCLWLIYLGTLAKISPTAGYDLNANLFDAYDCSQPYDIQDVGYSVATNCITNGHIVSSRNVTYQVLQEERHRKTGGWVCSVEKSQTVAYCGAFDHITILESLTYQNAPERYSAEDCKHLWKTQTFTDPNGRMHAVKQNAITIVPYSLKGSSFVQNGEVKCSGEDFTLPNGEVLNVAHVAIKLRFTLREEIYVIKNDEVTAHSTQTRLPCKAKKEKCNTPTAAYCWELPADSCELGFSRLSTGYEASNTKGETVFMSHDNSHVRFIKKESLNKCNRSVYRTNYPDWFLYPATGNNPFTRKVDPSAMSLVSYIKNRDDFLMNYLSDSIQDEFRYVIKGDCNRQAEISKLSFWLQHKDPGVTTWLLGNGTFATAAGEVIYQYQCLPVKVMALASDHCYQALPVELLEPITWRQTTTTTTPRTVVEATVDSPIDITRPLFMEPLTRRLTHHGIRVPCTNRFMAKYKNSNDGWITSHKVVHGATSPRLPADIEERLSALDVRNRPDMSQEGVYLPEDLANMEAYQDLPRATASLGANLIEQSRHNLFKHTLRPEDLFPNYQDPRKWLDGLWGRLMRFLQEWGELASVFISLYIIAKLSLYVVELSYNALILRDVHGCGRMLCWVPFTAIFLMRAYKDSPFGASNRERRAKKHAQLSRARNVVPLDGYEVPNSPNSYHDPRGEAGHPPEHAQVQVHQPPDEDAKNLPPPPVPPPRETLDLPKKTEYPDLKNEF
jgi:hypothetical protein